MPIPLGTCLHTLQRRAFRKARLEDQRAKAAEGPQLRRCLGSGSRRRAARQHTHSDHFELLKAGSAFCRPVDVLLLGLGSTIGSGVFVVTGVAANEHAGPAVIISYLVATLAALLSGLCYTQLVVDQPVVGGATVYIASIFGEFPSWIVASNLILEYSLSVAAVGRSASGYLATLLGLTPSFFTVRIGALALEPLSLVLILLLCGLLAHGTEASNRFNAVVTHMSVLSIAYVLAAGFPFGRAANLAPFAPHGLRGVFDASAIVFFSFVGFDSCATAAEEVHRPERDMPVGIIGSILISAALYLLMALCICLMQPAAAIDTEAPFAAAFTSLVGPRSDGAARVFFATSARFVSFGALTGIVTSLLVSILGQARIYVLLGRQGLLPAWLAAVHPTRGTPANATWLTGVSAGLLACLLSLDTLAELVSIGTLFVFFAVAAAVLWQRHGGGARLGGLLALNVALAAGLSLSYTFRGPLPLVAALGGLWVAAACALLLLPVAYRPQGFEVPLTPLVPALTMLATLHLICSLGWRALVRFAVWSLLSAGAYVAFCARAEEEGEGVALEGDEEVQLVAMPRSAGTAGPVSEVSEPAGVRVAKNGRTPGSGLS